MATISFIGSNFCAGNSHFTVTVSGAKSGSWNYSASEVLGKDPDAEEVRRTILTLLRLWANGKTPAQAKTALLAGFDVVIG